MLQLTEVYRPATLQDVRGQPAAVAVLSGWLRRPCPCAFVLHGPTGVGKTSAALALAADLGCDVPAGALGGVTTLASGEQTAEGVREAYASAWQTPLAGSGWRVLVVNECDRMTSQAETIWLDRLEKLPRRAVVVFTTNALDQLSDRFRDRCICLEFTANAKALHDSAYLLLSDVWRAETGASAGRERLQRVLKSATVQGQLSFRRALQGLVPELLTVTSAQA